MNSDMKILEAIVWMTNDLIKQYYDRVGDIKPDSNFDEEGIDSLGRINLFLAIEKNFDIQFDNEKVIGITDGVHTPLEAVPYIKEALEKKDG